MIFDSFFEKRPYDSYLIHDICNIHIIWLEILFLIQKFLRFARAKILNPFFLSNARAESNFNFQFELNVKFRVEWFALI